MTKATVTRLFIGSVLAVVAGAILAITAVWLAIANDVVRHERIRHHRHPGQRARVDPGLGFGHRRGAGRRRRVDRRPRLVDRGPA